MLNIAFCDTNQIFKDLFKVNGAGLQLLNQCLTELEQIQMGQYQGSVRQIQYLSGRLAAKKALQSTIENKLKTKLQNQQPRWHQQTKYNNLDIEIRNQNLSKQSLKPQVWINGIPNSVGMSISHSGNIACAAASSRQVGIDIEKISSRSKYFYEDVLTASEFEHWFTVQTDVQSENSVVADVFGTIYWTAKEAMGKCLGVGLSVPFNSFAIQLAGLSEMILAQPMILEKWFSYSGVFSSTSMMQTMQIWSRLLSMPDGEKYIVTVCTFSDL